MTEIHPKMKNERKLHSLNNDDNQKEKTNKNNQVMIKKRMIVDYLNSQVNREIDGSEDQVYVFGVVCIDFSLLNNEENAFKPAERGVHKLFFLKQEKFLIVYGEKPFCHTSQESFQSIIKRLSNASHIKLYELAQELDLYCQAIKEHQKIGKEYKNLLKSNNQITLYEECYQQFEQWALNYVTTYFLENKFYSFAILKFELNSLEVVIKVNGYNDGMLRLRGLNQYNYSRFFRKEMYHLYDRETIFQQAIEVIRLKTNQKSKGIKLPKIMRFDGREPVQAQKIKKISISNRDINFFGSQEIPHSTLPFEFLLVIQETIVDTKIFNELPSFESPSELESEDQCILDRYNIMSSEFEKKYYSDKICYMSCCLKRPK